MYFGLQGRSVLVAAASDGIGLAAAEGFAAEGAKVALCSRDLAKLTRAAERVRAQGGAAVLFEALDVTDENAVAAFVKRVAREFGGVDVCVTNAGGPPQMGFLETDTAGWQRAVDLNLLSTVHLARAVLPGMRRQRWGRIVTVTSVAVRQPVAELVYSNAVRAGVVGLVKSLSNEFGRDGITINNVAPGYTATERLKELAAKRAAAEEVTVQVRLERMGAETAMGRLGEAREVADAIVWLASERASYITGQTVLVDGGLYRGM